MNEDKPIRIQKTAFDKIEKYASKYNLTKKRMLEVFVSIGSKLCERMKGYHTLVLDDRVHISFFLDEDGRTEIKF